MEWRTIESAPRDGTLVDLWDDGAQFFRAMDVLAPSATKKRVATAQPPDLTEMPKKRTIEGRARKKQ